jgi:hypothetical protein
MIVGSPLLAMVKSTRSSPGKGGSSPPLKKERYVGVFLRLRDAECCGLAQPAEYAPRISEWG